MKYLVRYHVSKSFARATGTLANWPRHFDNGPYKRKITAIRKRRAANKERARFYDSWELKTVKDHGPTYSKVEIIEVPK